MMTSSLPDARTFLARYWQKKPLFARGVLPRFANALERAQIFELACRDDVESRLVTGARKSWRVEQGPFRRRDLMRLPPRYPQLHFAMECAAGSHAVAAPTPVGEAALTDVTPARPGSETRS